MPAANPAIPPNNAVGLIAMRFGARNAYGTGALIDASTVITCAHNFFHRASGQAATGANFHPRYSFNAWPAPGTGAPAVCAFYALAYAAGQDAWDIGLLRLAAPVQPAPAAFFVPQSTDGQDILDQNVTLTGYPGNRNGVMWTDTDQVNGVQPSTNTMLFTNDTAAGSSGSPIFIYDALDDVVRQYGVHNSQNPQFGLRRGLMFTAGVHQWIQNAWGRPAGVNFATGI